MSPGRLGRAQVGGTDSPDRHLFYHKFGPLPTTCRPVFAWSAWFFPPPGGVGEGARPGADMHKSFSGSRLGVVAARRGGHRARLPGRLAEAAASRSSQASGDSRFKPSGPVRPASRRHWDPIGRAGRDTRSNPPPSTFRILLIFCILASSDRSWRPMPSSRPRLADTERRPSLQPRKAGGAAGRFADGRKGAARAIMLRHPDPLIQKLIARLSDADPLTRRNAAAALRLHGRRATVAMDELGRLLGDEDPHVRAEAERALDRLRAVAV